MLGTNKMSCQLIENLGCIDEGSDSFYEYILENKEEYPIELADLLKWKLSDGVNILIDWTEIIPPAGQGEINIPGEFNVVADDEFTDRFLTIFATHDGGKQISKTIKYGIINSFNIDGET